MGWHREKAPVKEPPREGGKGDADSEVGDQKFEVGTSGVDYDEAAPRRPRISMDETRPFSSQESAIGTLIPKRAFNSFEKHTGYGNMNRLDYRKTGQSLVTISS